MSRRNVALATRKAVEVRQLQEQAALGALRTRHSEANETRREAQALADRHDRSLRAWAEAADRSRIDVGVLSLWRADSEDAGSRLESGRRALGVAEAALDDSRIAWAGRRRQAEAAAVAARQAARDLRRADEERRLREVEDQHFRRGEGGQ